MTAPTPSGGTPTPPIGSDGTPNLGSLTAPSGINGATSMWDWTYPTGLSGSQKLYFGNEQHSGEAPVAPHLTPGQDPYQTMHVETVQHMYNQFAAMSMGTPSQKQAFLSLQMALNNGNFGTVTPSGIMDPETQTALGKAIQIYQQYTKTGGMSMSFMDFLQNAGSGGGGTSFPSGSKSSGGSSSSGTKLAPTLRVDDPAYIRAAAQSAFENALGRQATKKELSKFVAQFQQMQKNYELTSPGQTGSSPDLNAEALQYAEGNNPNEFKQNQSDNYLDALVNMFAPSGSNRPTATTPTPNVMGGGG